MLTLLILPGRGDGTGTVSEDMPEDNLELVQPGMNILPPMIGRGVEFRFSRSLHDQVSFFFQVIEICVNPGLGNEDIIPTVDLVDNVIT